MGQTNNGDEFHLKSHPIDQAGRMEATNNGYFFKN